MSTHVDLDELERLAAAATDGPWAFASAPADESEETAAEYLAGAMTGDGPLFVVWVPATEGNPGGYRLTAATGDGPHASHDADFIAASRTVVPALIAELRKARAERNEALAAIERVRGEHRKFGIFEHEDSCGNHDNGHRHERHHEYFDEGDEYYCADMHIEDRCAGCRDGDGECVAWPCLTIQALEGSGR